MDKRHCMLDEWIKILKGKWRGNYTHLAIYDYGKAANWRYDECPCLPEQCFSKSEFDERLAEIEKWKEHNMNESTLVPREEMSDLDWLVRVTGGIIEPWCEFIARSGIDSWACTRVFDLERHWFTREQYLARRAELQNKPSWGSVGSDINFISQHDDGQWIGHSEKPSEAGECFECDCVVSLFGYGEVLGDWRDTLEKRPEQDEFEPFVSVEDAATANQPSITPSKYTKTIHGVSVDVYDVLQAWGVSNPALQHLIKKALQCGRRGHKDNAQDLQDIIDSAIRAKELEC